jgi:hypothetical protein
MHIPAQEWDTSAAYIGYRQIPLPQSGWIALAPERTRTFGLLGGSSAWKLGAPSVRVSLDQPRPVTGWMTATATPNDDNVGLWAAADEVLSAWGYRIVVGRSTGVECTFAPLSLQGLSGS